MLSHCQKFEKMVGQNRFQIWISNDDDMGKKLSKKLEKKLGNPRFIGVLLKKSTLGHLETKFFACFILLSYYNINI